ncbi:MAG: beta-ketoacyl synthase N-terminal-like domain-containing protein, partial [Eubacteriales bacterium]|nr:beta-ketoacyl synthase N-terminal-like domain-containing protein [Eubacteriales bacterium]
MDRRVVVTGMGVISSLGFDIETFWGSIVAGKSGIKLVSKFDASDYPTKVASEITDFDPSSYIDYKEAKRMDQFNIYAIAAAINAMKESGIDLDIVDKERMGVIVGSGIGGIHTLEDQHQVMMEKGPKRISPVFIPMMSSNMA